MWAPLALLLMVVTSALRALGGTGFGHEPGPEPLPTPWSLSALQPAPAAAEPLVAREASAPAPFQPPVLDPELLEPVVPAPPAWLAGSAFTRGGLDFRTESQVLDGVAGSPQLMSSFAGRALLPSGRLSLEAGVQLPLFDDRPGLPEPEFVLQFRLQF